MEKDYSHLIENWIKKPITIQAVLYDGSSESICAINQLGLNPVHLMVAGKDTDFKEDYIVIPTLEGDMKASVGDYIIKGINGEFYPCKSDIFIKTYEKAV
jgi:hypothetical protein